MRKKPERETSQSVELGFGSFQSRNAKFEATGAFEGSNAGGDANLYRVTAAYQNNEGYRGYGNKNIEFLPSFVFRTGKDQTTSFELRHIDSTIHNDSVGMPFRNRQILDVPQEFRYYTPFAHTESKIDRINLKHVARLNTEWALQANVS